MNELNSIQARVLACLMEKKETTPDHYPLTLNALRNACNQKSSRNPVVNYSDGEVGHALRELESMGFVREEWGARAHKYSHQAGKVLELYSQGLAIICTLMLRGPQTLGELKSHTHRMHEFEDIDDVEYALEKLATREPPLIRALPKQPGQKEGRYAHLLSGEPEIPEHRMPVERQQATPHSGLEDLEARVTRLEEELEALRSKIESD